VDNLKTGELIEIPEAGYLYGLGNLILRVTAVRPAPDREWVEVTGHEIAWNGKRLGMRAVVAKRSMIRPGRETA
jgi:hypothetical protein